MTSVRATSRIDSVMWKMSIPTLIARLDDLISMPFSEKQGIEVISYKLMSASWRKHLCEYSHMRITFYDKPDPQMVYDVLGYCSQCCAGDYCDMYSQRVETTHMLYLTYESWKMFMCKHFDLPPVACRFSAIRSP